MKKSPTAEIISVGNELLIGHTLDTNSHWIAKRLTRFGWTLLRITVLRDSLGAIKDGVTGALRRRPDLLITLGGLGPTHDDMTLKGVALALNKGLVLNSEAFAMVKARYNVLEASTGLTRTRSNDQRWDEKACLASRGSVGDESHLQRIGNSDAEILKDGSSRGGVHRPGGNY